jgi:hypothetical protein
VGDARRPRVPGPDEGELPSRDRPDASRDPRIDPLWRRAPIRWSAPSSPAELDEVAHRFDPLRVAPPPDLVVTRWFRYGLVVTILLASVVVPIVEWSSPPGRLTAHPVAVILHVSIALLLVGWTARATENADRLLPPSRYRAAPRPRVAVALWIAASVAPLAVAGAALWFGDDAVGSSAVAPALAMALVLVAASMVVYAPFRYLASQARRLGAPPRDLTAWFWAPVLTGVGALALLGLGLGDDLASGGLSAGERGVRVAVGYGLPALVFALATARAVTVFDELIDLRRERWRVEWERTLADLADQPPVT